MKIIGVELTATIFDSQKGTFRRELKMFACDVEIPCDSDPNRSPGYKRQPEMQVTLHTTQGDIGLNCTLPHPIAERDQDPLYKAAMKAS